MMTVLVVAEMFSVSTRSGLLPIRFWGHAGPLWLTTAIVSLRAACIWRTQRSCRPPQRMFLTLAWRSRWAASSGWTAAASDARSCTTTRPARRAGSGRLGCAYHLHVVSTCYVQEGGLPWQGIASSKPMFITMCCPSNRAKPTLCQPHAAVCGIAQIDSVVYEEWNRHAS